jgi:hypothetical protein
MYAPRSLFAAGLVVVTLAACRPDIGGLNANAPKYYEERVTVKARVSRRQIVDGQTLLELADGRERRILALLETTDAPKVGEWVRVRGVLTADRRVGDVIVYDLIVADDVDTVRGPSRWRLW